MIITLNENLYTEFGFNKKIRNFKSLELTDDLYSRREYKKIGEHLLDDDGKNYVEFKWCAAAKICNYVSEKMGLEPCYYIDDELIDNIGLASDGDSKDVECRLENNGWRLPFAMELLYFYKDTDNIFNEENVQQWCEEKERIVSPTRNRAVLRNNINGEWPPEDKSILGQRFVISSKNDGSSREDTIMKSYNWVLDFNHTTDGWKKAFRMCRGIK